MRLEISRSGSKPIQRTLDTGAALRHDMGIDHGGLDTRVAEQFLDRPDVIALLQKMRGKGMTQRITTLLMNRDCRKSSTGITLSLAKA